MPHPLVGINAGSGQRSFNSRTGWVNFDIRPTAHHGVAPDVVADMFHMPFRNGCADYVVSHHTIEHLGCGEADGFIAEVLRVLRPSGSFLVFVPDMRALAQRYLTHQFDPQLYFCNIYGAYQGSEYDRHKWGYDRDCLTEYLRRWPWRIVGAFDWRPIAGADIARDWWILGMECVR